MVSGWSRRWGTPQGQILTNVRPNPTSGHQVMRKKPPRSVPSKGVLGVPKKHLISTQTIIKSHLESADEVLTIDIRR